MPGDCGLDRLPDPPHRIGDELDPPVRIELPGGGHQTHVPLADQVHQRHAAVLELLGHRDHEPNVMPGELLLRLYVPLERTPGHRRLLLHRQQGDTADLLEIEIQALPSLVDGLSQGSWPSPTPTGLLGTCHFALPYYRPPRRARDANRAGL